MRIICLSILVLFTLFGRSQEPADGVFPIKDGSIYYEKIVTVDSVSKDQLYKIAKTWGVGAFKSQKDVLQADDREVGLIAYKSFFPIHFSSPKILGISAEANWQYWFTMKIFIKEEKAKIVVESIELKNANTVVGVSENPPILTFKRDTEEGMKRGMFGKGYRDKFYAETKENFLKANATLTGLINDLANTFKTGKSEFDF